MIVPKQLSALCRQAIACNASDLADQQQLVSVLHVLLGWESREYIARVIAGRQCASSIADLQRIYWALGVVIEGHWRKHQRFNPPDQLSTAA